jgi:hypothetical protein
MENLNIAKSQSGRDGIVIDETTFGQAHERARPL